MIQLSVPGRASMQSSVNVLRRKAWSGAQSAATLHNVSLAQGSMPCGPGLRRDKYEKHVKLYWVEKHMQGKTLTLGSQYIKWTKGKFVL